MNELIALQARELNRRPLFIDETTFDVGIEVAAHKPFGCGVSRI